MTDSAMSVKEIEVNVKMMVRGKKTMKFEGSQPIVNVFSNSLLAFLSALITRSFQF